MSSSNQSELKIRDGKNLKYASNLLPVRDYVSFIQMYDWCKVSVGEFDQDWSTVWEKGSVYWNFKRREDLTMFLLTWY